MTKVSNNMINEDIEKKLPGEEYRLGFPAIVTGIALGLMTYLGVTDSSGANGLYQKQAEDAKEEIEALFGTSLSEDIDTAQVYKFIEEKYDPKHSSMFADPKVLEAELANMLRFYNIDEYKGEKDDNDADVLAIVK